MLWQALAYKLSDPAAALRGRFVAATACGFSPPVVMCGSLLVVVSYHAGFVTD